MAKKNKKAKAKKQFKQSVRAALTDDSQRKKRVSRSEIKKSVKKARRLGVGDKFLRRNAEKLVEATGKKGAKLRSGARKLLGIKNDRPKPKPDKDPFEAETIDYKPRPNALKKWKPEKIEQSVKKRWDEIKSKYKGPQRLTIKHNATGLMKKYGKEDGGFDRKKFLSDTKTSAFERYKALGGIRDKKRVLSRTPPKPKFDKIPGEYSESLNAVRSSLSGIQKRGGPELAKKVGKQLSGQYTPKSDYGSRGLDLIGPSNSPGSAPSRKRRKQSMGLRTHARINR
jgi:hypothetical protein